MSTIEAVKFVLENGCCQMRPRKGTPHQWDVRPQFNGNKRGWFYMDIQTANMLNTVYGALKPEHQEKFDRIPLVKLVDFGWKAVRQ